MTTKTSRTERILLRVSPAEKELIRERAGGARRMSDYIRRVAIEGAGAGRAGRPPKPHRESSNLSAPADFEQRVAAKMHSNGVPRRSAAILVKREMARESAGSVSS